MRYNESPNVAHTSEANEEITPLPTENDFRLVLLRCCIMYVVVVVTFMPPSTSTTRILCFSFLLPIVTRQMEYFKFYYHVKMRRLNCNFLNCKKLSIDHYEMSLLCRKILTAVESGHVKVCSHMKDSSSIIDTGGSIEKMRHNLVNGDIIAVGGKENDLNLWNLEVKTCTFKAKNVSLILF
jgi:hypothetical protein